MTPLSCHCCLPQLMFLLNPVSAEIRIPTPNDLVPEEFIQDLSQNPEEQSVNSNPALMQGDIMPTAAGWDNRDMTLPEDRKWTSHKIPYTIEFGGNVVGQEAWIESRIDYVLNWEFRAKLGDCLEFVPRKDERNYIKIRFDRSGCWAHMGKQS